MAIVEGVMRTVECSWRGAMGMDGRGVYVPPFAVGPAAATAAAEAASDVIQDEKSILSLIQEVNLQRRC